MPAATGSATEVHLSDVQRLLALFAQGISGRYLQLRPVDALTGKFRPRGPTTDGTAIYLEASVDTFGPRRHNLGLYRIAILHQLGFFENGTFAFALEAARAALPGLPAEAQPGEPEATGLERFFGLWPAPELMRHLLMTLEDLRVDAAIRRRYPGARADLERVLAHALATRPDRSALSPFGALLEGLVQYTLGADPDTLAATDPTGRLRLAIEAARPVADAEATVIDSARAATVVYRLLEAAGLPRRPPDPWRKPPAERPGGGSAPGADAGTDDGDDGDGPLDDEALTGFPVPFRGDVQPGLVQRQLRAQGIVGQLDAEMAPGEAPDAPAAQTPEELARTLRADHGALRRAFGRHDDGARSYLYDEWNFLEQRWLKGWCRLLERRLRGENFDFIRDVRERHAALAHQVKRQFRFLKPESYQRIRKVSDGEELELDGIIEAVIDRRTGHATDERVYVRRAKAQRDVAAAFLLDMSASTDFQIPDPDAPPPASAEPEPEEEDIPFLWNFQPQALDEADGPPKRRVIDVARESLALMSEALETLGDRHAVYGFSGYGRDEVEFYVAKAFDDRVSSRTWAAMAAMEPKRSTRMGPAIRHALAKLALQDARMKVLVIVSDGFPEDCDYGPDRNDREYGIQDTAMALREAERAGVEAFCITVDRAGNDYLRRMCAPDRYLVIDEVAALPRELTKVYRVLTA